MSDKRANDLNLFKKDQDNYSIDTSKKLKVGIIGTGWIAESHISEYLKMPDVELVGVADLVDGKAEEGKDYDLDRLTWLWKVTTGEDKAIIEHTARGVRSHYFVPGPIAPMEHNELRYIDWYLDEISRSQK